MAKKTEDRNDHLLALLLIPVTDKKTKVKEGQIRSYPVVHPFLSTRENLSLPTCVVLEKVESPDLYGVAVLAPKSLEDSLLWIKEDTPVVRNYVPLPIYCLAYASFLENFTVEVNSLSLSELEALKDYLSQFANCQTFFDDETFNPSTIEDVYAAFLQSVFTVNKVKN